MPRGLLWGWLDFWDLGEAAAGAFETGDGDGDSGWGVYVRGWSTYNGSSLVEGLLLAVSGCLVSALGCESGCDSGCVGALLRDFCGLADVCRRSER